MGPAPFVRGHAPEPTGERVNTYCRLYYRVPFSETDAMGIVHHSNHARYMERGRVEFLRLAGLDYTKVIERGFHFPLTDIRVSFKRPLVFDEIVCIETALTDLSKVRLTFAYRFHTASELLAPALHTETLSGKPSVEGETFHCAVNLQNRPAKISEDLYEQLAKIRGSL